MLTFYTSSLQENKMFSAALFFSLLYVVQPYSNIPVNNACEGGTHPGNWICDKNEDGTVNVTFDCHSNPEDIKAIELWLWSPKFPSNMKALTVKNCDGLTLDINCHSNRSMTHFSNLYINNVSDLYITRKPRGGETYSEPNGVWGSCEKTWWNLENKESYESELVSNFCYLEYKHMSSGQLPKNVILENIGLLDVFGGHALISDPDKVCFENVQLESLKMINVTSNMIRKMFIGSISSIKELAMENVRLNLWSFRSGLNAGVINNEKAIIKITNSTISVQERKFLECNAWKVLITRSNFRRLHHLPLIDCNAELFEFSENVVEIGDEEMKSSFLKLEGAEKILGNNAYIYVKTINNTFY